MIHRATLCIGSNSGDRMANILAATDRIASVATIVWMSAVLESLDISGRGCCYLNRALKCTTMLTKEELCRELARFEGAGGRIPSSKASGKMPIDIDLVVWDDEIASPADFQAEYFRRLVDDGK